jgi:hypothetical protein
MKGCLVIPCVYLLTSVCVCVRARVRVNLPGSSRFIRHNKRKRTSVTSLVGNSQPTGCKTDSGKDVIADKIRYSNPPFRSTPPQCDLTLLALLVLLFHFTSPRIAKSWTFRINAVQFYYDRPSTEKNRKFHP